MDPIKKILAPTDLSELSQLGVRYALNLAKAIEAEVTVYHVVDYDTLIRYGQRSTASSSFHRLISTSWRGTKTPYPDS